MTYSQRVRVACYPVFLASTIIAVLLALAGIWLEAESLALWKTALSAAVVSLASALVLSATRVTFGNGLEG